MKSKPNLFAPFSLAITAIGILAFSQSLQAAALTWDTIIAADGTITAGSGTWSNGAGNWNNGTTSVAINWTNGTAGPPVVNPDSATFAGTDTGSKTITVGGGIIATGLTFNNSGYTLSASSAQTVSIAGTQILTVASGKTATIGNNVTVAGASSGTGFSIAGSGTLNISGSGARVLMTDNNISLTSGPTVNVTSSGTLTTNSQLVIGTSTSSTNLTVDGGTVSAGRTVVAAAQNIVLANASTGTVSSTLTLTSGSVTNLGTYRVSGESGLRFGSTTAGGTISGTVNLDGGTLTVARVYEGNTGGGLTSNFNFNGGTLKVTTGASNAANFMAGLDNVKVKEGGAVIDTNGIATSIGQALQHGGVAATDGGLTKNGTGALTLTGSNTYTGTTTVNVGTLTLGHATNTLLDTGAVAVAGGILDVANADTVGAVTLSGGTISGAAVLTGSSYDLQSGTISGGVLASGAAKNKTTSGTVTLAGTQNYTDATNVNQGTLNVTGSLASSITVANGAQLKGEGSTSGNLTFQAGSKFLFDPLTTGATDFFRSAGTIDTTAGGTSKIVIDLASTVSTGTGYVVFQGSSINSNGLSDFKLNSRGTLNITSTQLLFDAGVGSVVWKGGNTINPTFWDVNTTAQNFTLSSVDDFFLSGDNVTFDDTAASYSVVIQGTSVSPGSVTFDNSANSYSVSGGAIAGNTSIVKSGTNTVILSNTNTNTGGTTINAGTIQLGDGTNGTGSLIGAIVNNGTLATNFGVNNVTLSNDISGTGAFAKSGSGTVILTGANTYGGTTTINAGTLQIGSNGTVGALGTGAVLNNGTLVFDRTDTVVANNNISGTGSITKQRASSLTLGGTLSHGAGISVSAGTLSLGGNNTYAGQTTVSAGAGIIITANNALGATGTGNETVLSGTGGANSGALGLSGGINYSAGEKVIGAGVGNTAANGAFAAAQRGLIQSISGDNTFAGNIEISATGITRFGTQDGADLTLSGSIKRGSGVSTVSALFRSGTSGDWVTVSGSGSNWDSETLVFTGAISGAGGVRLGANDGLSTVATIRAGGNTTGSGTTLDLNGFNQTVSGLNNSNGTLHITNSAASTTSVFTLNTASNQSSDASVNLTTIEDGAGKVSLVKSGTFTQTLAGTHTYSGDTVVNAGTLALTSAATINNSTKIIVGDAGSSGAVLNVTAKSSFTVSSTQTLSGIGTVNIGSGKTVTIDGVHTPGNGTGAQSVTGNLSYSSTSIFEWDLASNNDTDGIDNSLAATTDNGIAGTDFDTVTTTGNLSIDSLAVFKVITNGGVDFSNSFWTANQSWSNIFNVTGTTTSGWSNYAVSVYNTSNVLQDVSAYGTFAISGTTLSWTAVPEPTSALAGLLITAGLLRRRRNA